MEIDTTQQICQDDFNPNLSLYLPSLDEEVTQLALRTLFQSNKIGVVERVDFVYNTKGVRQGFIHLSQWFDNMSLKLLGFAETSPKS